MNNNCDIVRDLLPLYIDEVCSPSSGKIVDEHLSQCDDCRTLLEKMRSNTVEQSLKSEKEIAIRNFKFKGAALAGAIIAGILMIPILICLIVNLASGHALDWFFIVLSALCVFASVTVVPLMVPKYKFPLTVGAFAASLLLLFGVCCIYSGGSWFFIASSAVLFGLAVVLLPIVANCQPLKELLGNHKVPAVLGCDTFLLFLMFLSIGFKVKSTEYNRITSAVVIPIVAFVWLVFALLRYPRSKLLGWGLVVAAAGIFFFFAPSLIGALLNSPVPIPVPGDWQSIDGTNGNISWLILITCVIVGGILAAVGIIKNKKENSKA